MKPSERVDARHRELRELHGPGDYTTAAIIEYLDEQHETIRHAREAYEWLTGTHQCYSESTPPGEQVRKAETALSLAFDGHAEPWASDRLCDRCDPEGAPRGGAGDEEGARAMYEHCVALMPHNCPPWVNISGTPGILESSRVWWTAAFRFARDIGAKQEREKLSHGHNGTRHELDRTRWGLAQAEAKLASAESRAEKAEAKLAAAEEKMRFAITALEETRWNPDGEMGAWARSPDGQNHARVMRALEHLRPERPKTGGEGG